MTIESEESIGALVGRLADDARDYAHAEIDFYRTLATQRLAEARIGLTFGGIALVLAIAGAIALVVGSLLALATLIGPGLATLATVAVTFIIAGLLGWLAYRHIAKVFGRVP